jgi:intergrase/recombinase
MEYSFYYETDLVDQETPKDGFSRAMGICEHLMREKLTATMRKLRAKPETDQS